ncbi:M50 family metallopeptidase [Aliidiomarina quisquiliarum]|uniref:M50 family metallopeptidase n=1 Tax=Aliidiomarina quisquiliarum TaxID=2938947 RepID=UPI00208FBD6F|nr:M50 family metallopeptidase [Aliidiomarina quisquiliarum]MCO4319959.1 M50 family metallopeptidase [Aliidiomarina quisquiliarum]
MIIEAFFSLLVAAAGLWLPLLLLVKTQTIMLQRVSAKVWMPFAIIGVPIHELSHFFACKLFGHKVIRLELFKPDKSGTLGFVEHSYVPSVRSWFANMLIGIAPFVGGAVFIYCVTYLLASELLYRRPLVDTQLESIVVLGWSVWSETFSAIQTLHWGRPWSWLWLYLCVATAMFMVPSAPDFQGAAKGIVALVTLLLLFVLLSPEKTLSAIAQVSVSFYALYPLWIAALVLFLALIALSLFPALSRQSKN